MLCLFASLDEREGERNDDKGRRRKEEGERKKEEGLDSMAAMNRLLKNTQRTPSGHPTDTQHTLNGPL